MRTETLERAVLEISREGEFYGYEDHRQLSAKGVKVEIGRFYKVLTRMSNEGFLESHWERSQSGPRKRMYRLGTKGRRELDRILLDAIKTVHASYEDYLSNLSLKFNPLESVWSFLTGRVKRKATIAYVTLTYPYMIEKVMHTLHSKVTEGRIYLVSPSPTAVKPNIDGLFLLNGAYDDIPLKNGYVDLLVVADLPRMKLLKIALREWRRVLAPKGMLAILTPSFLTRKYEDPLTIGEFVEKHERGLSEKVENVDKQYLIVLLKNFFQKVEERHFVHMTILSASEPIS